MEKRCDTCAFLLRELTEDNSISFTNAKNELHDFGMISEGIHKQMTSLRQLFEDKVSIIKIIESDYLEKNLKQLAACESEMSQLQLVISEWKNDIHNKETINEEAREFFFKIVKNCLEKVKRDIESVTEHSHSSFEISDRKSIPREMIPLLEKLNISVYSIASKINTVAQEFKDASQQFGSIEIRDCAFLKNSDIIFSDKINKRLLVYGRDTTFKKDVPFEEMPFSVVAIGQTEVAVSFPNSRCVKCLDVYTNVVIREFTFDGPCTGISVYKDLLAVRVEKLYCYIKYISNGDTHKVVKIKDEFTSYVALRDGSIYFTNWNKNKVVCMTLDGEIKWEFKNENLKKPNGIVTDKHGNAFVAGYSSGNIFFVTKDGLNLKQIVIKYDSSSANASPNETENSNPISIDINDNNELLVCSITGFSISKINI